MAVTRRAADDDGDGRGRCRGTRASRPASTTPSPRVAGLLAIAVFGVALARTFDVRAHVRLDGDGAVPAANRTRSESRAVIGWRALTSRAVDPAARNGARSAPSSTDAFRLRAPSRDALTAGWRSPPPSAAARFASPNDSVRRSKCCLSTGWR